MKSIYRIICLSFCILIILFTSCRKEELDEAIVGRWDLIKDVSVDYQNEVQFYSFTRIYPQGSKVYLFYENDTLKVYDDEVADTLLFLWRIKDGFLFQSIVNVPYSENKTSCNINNDIMTLTTNYKGSSVPGIVFKNVYTSTFYRNN